eukprot:m.259236 g.259236  ORF g.259236 m.259236 type:complete len:695 (-) comp26635_c0_seq15:505-2589(-)
MADDGMEAEGLGSESPEREELAQALALSMNLDDEHAATAAAAAPAATAAAAPVAAVAPTRGAPPPERRGRGRPKGSKNKSKEPQAPGDDDVIEIDEREIDEAALEEEAITWVMMRMEDFKGAKALKGKHIRTFERRLEKLYVTRMVNGHAVTFEEVLNLAKKTKDADVKVAAPPRTSEAEDLYLELVAVCERELARLEGAGYEKLSFDLGASDPFADLTGKVGNLVFEVEIVTRAKESQKGADLISRLNRVALGRLVLARRMHAKDATTRQGYLAWLKSPGIELSPPFAYECSVMAGIFMCIPNVIYMGRLARLLYYPGRLLTLCAKNEKEHWEALQTPFLGAEIKLGGSTMSYPGCKAKPMRVMFEVLGRTKSFKHSEPTEKELNGGFPHWDAEHQESIRKSKKRRHADDFTVECPAGRPVTVGQREAMQSVLQFETLGELGNAAPYFDSHPDAIIVNVKIAYHYDPATPPEWVPAQFTMSKDADVGMVVQAYEYHVAAVVKKVTDVVNFKAFHGVADTVGEDVEPYRKIGDLIYNGEVYVGMLFMKLGAAAEPIPLRSKFEPDPPGIGAILLEELEAMETEQRFTELEQRLFGLEYQAGEAAEHPPWVDRTELTNSIDHYFSEVMDTLIPTQAIEVEELQRQVKAQDRQLSDIRAQMAELKKQRPVVAEAAAAAVPKVEPVVVDPASAQQEA